MSLWRRLLGQQGERIAADYLHRQGYRIQQQNYRCRSGEIDIIAWDGSTLVFVEVKSKRQSLFGPPQAMVDAHKQRTMTRVAMTYVQQNHLPRIALRFDVVAVTFSANGVPEVTHVPAAFSAQGDFFY